MYICTRCAHGGIYKRVGIARRGSVNYRRAKYTRASAGNGIVGLFASADIIGIGRLSRVNLFLIVRWWLANGAYSVL